MKRKRSINVSTAIVFAVLCLGVLQAGIYFAETRLDDEGKLSGFFQSDIFNTILWQCLCILLCLLRYRIAPDPKVGLEGRAPGGRERRELTPAKALLVFLASAMFIDMINNIAIFSARYFHDPAYASVMQTLKMGRPQMVILSVALLGPVYEELLFRGIIYRGCRNASGYWLSAVLSSGLWGLSHMNLTQGLATFVMGLLLCYIYEIFRSILLVILIHIANNSLGLFVKTSIGIQSGHMMYILLISTVELLLTILIMSLLGRGRIRGRFDGRKV